MKTKMNRFIIYSCLLIFAFAVWTLLIQTVDVQPIGVNRTDIGFAKLNTMFHSLLGVNMALYTVTDWLGIIPVFVCMIFGVSGLAQALKRKSLIRVDADIIVLGIYYVIVIFFYLIFEVYPINYRPILINSFMEASYPSSTTLLVLSVMPTLVFHTKRRMKSNIIKIVISIFSILLSVFMVVGRIISGVHWITDIVGSILLSEGLFFGYKAVVLMLDRNNGRTTDGI